MPLSEKGVTSMNNGDIKFKCDAWKKLKDDLLRLNEDVKIESLHICSYCCPILNGNNIPCHCMLSGLQAEPIPAELSALDALSKQLIQQAKSF